MFFYNDTDDYLVITDNSILMNLLYYMYIEYNMCEY